MRHERLEPPIERIGRMGRIALACRIDDTAPRGWNVNRRDDADQPACGESLFLDLGLIRVIREIRVIGSSRRSWRG